MNSIPVLFLNFVVAVLSFNQFPISSDTEQSKLSNLGAEQSYYNQVYEQYFNYYNYLYQQNCILNNQNNNNVNTSSIPTNITNSIPINVFKVENRTTNDEQPILTPTFPRKNKILLLHTPNIEPKKPLKTKIRDLICRSQKINK